MLDPSQPLTPAAIVRYHKKDLTAATNSYFTQGNAVQGEWSGTLAKEIGLVGPVTHEMLSRLAYGQDPHTGEQLVERRSSDTTQQRGGWDLTFNAPKTVSLTALVGGDYRVIEAHRRACRVALEAMERQVQQRMGGNNIPVTTGKWIVASFEHNAARPDGNGYPAPHLHTHNIVFNLTAIDGDAQARAIQSQAIFAAQKFGTAVYQAELARELEKLGYQLKRGKNNAPDIKGYTQQYLDEESPGAKRIQQRLVELGVSGRRAERIVAHQDRNDKIDLTQDELKALHLAKAEIFGNQPAAVVKEVFEHGQRITRSAENTGTDAYAAVEYARTKLSERTAVFEEHELARHALRYRVSGITVSDVETAIAQHKTEGHLVPVSHVNPHGPGQRFTTAEMLKMEQELLAWATGSKATVKAIAPFEELRRFSRLDDNQPRRELLKGYLQTTDQVTLLRGGAGSGKTTGLGMLTEIARENGYKVVGLAPVGKAVIAMREQGIDAQTLQRFVKRGIEDEDSRKRLFLLDEASLTPTRALHSFMKQVRPEDHVILIGDPRQHTPVQAGFVFEQLMDAGVKCAQLNKNYRQEPEDLKLAVNLMASGRTREFLSLAEKKGWIIELPSSHDRYSVIAKDYAVEPVGSTVTSPDNDSRAEINLIVRAEMRHQDLIGKDLFSAQILVSRDVYDEDHKLAHTYRPGDRLRYHQAHQKLGIAAKSYATVISVDSQANQITVELSGGKQQTYDPRRAHGVSIYETQEIPLAIGERVQFTAPFRQFANREMGTIDSLDQAGNIRLILDDGRIAEWNLKKNPHIDYAYSMTSHALQGATVNRQLVNIETLNSHVDPLLDRTFGYVASSRPRYELRIYTDSKAELATKLDRVHEKYKALSDEQTHEYSRTLAIAI